VGAYLGTTYHVAAPSGPIALRIGIGSRHLDRALSLHRARHWAFITACNPRSRVLPRWHNALRQRRLHALVTQLGYLAWPGAGIGESPYWQPEPSLLVVGIPVAAAVRLGRQFRQNAIVAGRRGRAPELVWCGSVNR